MLNKIIILIFIIIFNINFLTADTDKKEELTKVKASLNQKKEALKRSKIREKNIKQEVSNIYSNINKTKQNIKILESSLNQCSLDYVKNLEQLNDAKQKEDKYKKMLGYNLSLLYKQKFLNNNSFFDMLDSFLSANKTFLDNKKLEYHLKSIFVYNENVCEKIIKNKNQLDAKKEKLDKDLTYMSNRKQNFEKKESELSQKHTKKQKELENEKQKQKEYQQEIKKLEETAKELESLITKLLKKSDQKRSYRGNTSRYNEVINQFGHIKKPVQGQIILKYGKNKHPHYDTFHISNGIEIKTRHNENVQAIEAGKIVFCNDFSNYGKTIIIDHGKGAYSVYAYLSDILVKNNEQITKRQVIGNSGVSNYTKENALYFEVRIDGVAMDPEIWLE